MTFLTTIKQKGDNYFIDYEDETIPIGNPELVLKGATKLLVKYYRGDKKAYIMHEPGINKAIDDD